MRELDPDQTGPDFGSQLTLKALVTCIRFIFVTSRKIVGAAKRRTNDITSIASSKCERTCYSFSLVKWTNSSNFSPSKENMKARCPKCLLNQLHIPLKFLSSNFTGLRPDKKCPPFPSNLTWVFLFKFLPHTFRISTAILLHATLFPIPSFVKSGISP